MFDILPLLIVFGVGFFFSELFSRLHLPYVTALIIAGMVIGPFGLNLVGDLAMLESLGLIGLVMMMYLAGTEANLQVLSQLKSSAIKMSVVMISISFAVGLAIGGIFNWGLLASILMGAMTVSSSVAVIIPTLQEHGLMKLQLGRLIVASTVVADVVSLLLVAVVFQLFDPSQGVPIWAYLPLILFVIGLVIAVVPLLHQVFHAGKKGQDLFESEIQFVIVTLLLVIVLFQFLGLHPLLAGFIGGVTFGGRVQPKVAEKMHSVAYGVFIPFFFLNLGVQTNFVEVVSARGGMLTLAVVGGLFSAKLVGGILAGAWLRYTIPEQLIIGFGHLPQVSTTLAAAAVGVQSGLLPDRIISSLVVLSAITTIVTPFSMKLLAKRARKFFLPF